MVRVCGGGDVDVWRKKMCFFFAVLVHSSALPPAARVRCLLLYDVRDRAASLPVLHIIIISSTSCHQIWLRSRARKTKTANVAVEENQRI